MSLCMNQWFMAYGIRKKIHIIRVLISNYQLFMLQSTIPSVSNIYCLFKKSYFSMYRRTNHKEHQKKEVNYAVCL